MDCASPTFERFVENVLRLEPAWCSRMFEDYVGVPGHEIDFVGRFESLADDLVRALRTIGARFDEQAIRNTPAVNVSPTSGRLAHWSDDLARRVRQSERAAITRFGYDAPEMIA